MKHFHQCALFDAGYIASENAELFRDFALCLFPLHIKDEAADDHFFFPFI
jgi:hypothetical protein